MQSIDCVDNEARLIARIERVFGRAVAAAAATAVWA